MMVEGSEECKTCEGTGVVCNGSECHECPDCKGSGVA